MNAVVDLFAFGSLLVAWAAPSSWNMRDYLAAVAVGYVVYRFCGGRKVPAQ